MGLLVLLASVEAREAAPAGGKLEERPRVVDT